MRQGPSNKRMRGRGNGRKHSNPRNQNFESNGPDVKVRGNAQQVVEKYLALARDAYSAGDRINAENYYQHAEHYYRIMNAHAANEQRQAAQMQPGADANGEAAEFDDDQAAEAGEEQAPREARSGDRGRRRGRRNGHQDLGEAPQPEVDGPSVAAGEDGAPDEASESASA